MRFPEKQYPHSELTEQIISCAQLVHNTLKNGLNEKIYENSLCVEFPHRNIFFSQQAQFPVSYRNKPVGKLIPDLIVAENVIVDTKVVEDFNASHTSQILSYLNITGLEVGLLLNFKHASLKIKRITKLNNY